jgi:cyclopropane fatty-acyl-phospholipid synthase-like methyltransferase
LVLVTLLVFGGVVAAQEHDYGEDHDVPYVPTPYDVVRGMLKLANVKSGDYVIDLGCGDGRIVVTAAKEFGARGKGFDLNPKRIQEANENASSAGVKDRVEFIEKNLFDADISQASVVTLYLLPSVNEKLKPRLLSQLRPGTRVVSHAFDMGDWKPNATREVDGRKMYLWIIPEKKQAE